MKMPSKFSKALPKNPFASEAPEGGKIEPMAKPMAKRMPLESSKAGLGPPKGDKNEPVASRAGLVSPEEDKIEPVADRMQLESSKAGLVLIGDLQAPPSRPPLDESPEDPLVAEIVGRAPQLVPGECGNAKNEEPWCLSVLRTEARLRLSQTYIGATCRAFDAGQSPDPALDFEVERQALKLHGYDPDTAVESYRLASRSLSPELRKEIFFLRANDRLFRPHLPKIGATLEGSLIPAGRAEGRSQRGVAMPFAELTQGFPRALLVASTAS